MRSKKAPREVKFSKYSIVVCSAELDTMTDVPATGGPGAYFLRGAFDVVVTWTSPVNLPVGGLFLIAIVSVRWTRPGVEAKSCTTAVKDAHDDCPRKV